MKIWLKCIFGLKSAKKKKNKKKNKKKIQGRPYFEGSVGKQETQNLFHLALLKQREMSVKWGFMGVYVSISSLKIVWNGG